MATTNSLQVVVADAGPLIHLDELGCLDILADYTELLVPDAVWQEVLHHRPQALQHPRVNFKRQNANVISLQVEALTPLYTLHKGEREALMLCVQFEQSLLLTDDTAARLAAKSLTISAHGTLGLLARSVRRGLRTADEVLALLAAIPSQSTLHIRPALLIEVMQQVKTAWQP
ncbi:MAG: hypothetical protein Q7S87_07175 [Agitococcus sp.]|nr:hypothetical protein [Agitococcus sp.]